MMGKSHTHTNKQTTTCLNILKKIGAMKALLIGKRDVGPMTCSLLPRNIVTRLLLYSEFTVAGINAVI